jgi:alpha-2-macroglobulin
MRPSSPKVIKIMLLFLILAGFACSVPFVGGPTPTPTPAESTPTPTAEPTPRADLPPALVETFPPEGSEVSLDGPVVFAFNQPMDRGSVEAAFQSATGLTGRFDWLDDQTLWFYPDSRLEPGTELDVTIGSSAQAANGRGLLAPINIKFVTVGYLRLAQALPQPGTLEANPGDAVVAAFNRPVIALGSNSAELPAAFRLEPAAEGRGEWLNTSTYVFYPDPALQGGQEYRVILEDDLVGVDGAPLDGLGIVADGSQPPNQSFAEWTFRTAMPEVVGLTPATELALGLDVPISILFNQPMDQASTEANFALQGPEGRVGGNFAWEDSFTSLIFTPTNLLSRSTNYTLRLAGNALAAGGTPLRNDLLVELRTYPDFAVGSSLPEQGGVLNPQASVQIFFTSPPPLSDLSRFVSITPRVTNFSSWYYDFENSLNINGDFLPGVRYTITLSADLADRWGQTLPGPYDLQFTVSDYPASIQVQGGYGGSVLFAPTTDRGLPARVLNLSTASLEVGTIPLDRFLDLSTSGVYDAFQNFVAADGQAFDAAFNLTRNRAEDVILPLSAGRAPLAPGLYHVRIDSVSQDTPSPFVLVVSDVQLAFKLSATEALVWAVRLGDLSPVADAPVVIYDETGQQVAAGRTDSAGLFRSVVPVPADPYAARYAVVEQPGSPDFSLALSTWEQGIASWELGVQADYTPPRLFSYFYTDRPIYRPGEEVNFRGVLRQAYNGRYEMPEVDQVRVMVTGADGLVIQELDLEQSVYGTVSGSFSLSPNAQPGYYSITNITQEDSYGGVGFTVAEYRTSEINLDLSTPSPDLLAGESLAANLQASYFFGSPAADLPLEWVLYRRITTFDLPGFSVGPQEPGWLSYSFPVPRDFLGEEVERGSGMTGADGGYSLALETPFPDQPAPEGSTWLFTLEITARDETGLPVSARVPVEVHPSPAYFGLAARSWVSQAGEPLEVDLRSVDWLQQPLPGSSFIARFFSAVTQAGEEINPDGSPRYVTEYTQVAEQSSQTDAQGAAVLRFTPPEPGTYRVSVSGDGAHSDVFVWVSGPGTAAFPELPNQALVLAPDRESYQPGETAGVFIPNPFNRPVPALVTIERGTLLEAQSITLPANGELYAFDVTSEDAPNVFVTALLLGSGDFRYGVQNVPVAPLAQALAVELVTQPERTGPGDEVTFSLRVTDSQGNPVQGEFSLAVVNEAVLALTDPNSTGILEAFYREQPLGVRTGLTLAAYAGRVISLVGGLGGGGGAAEPAGLARSDFRDTAYWNGTIVTGEDGTAQVTATLPDNLTTWKIDVRGVDDRTLVGEAQASLLTTKELIVRPVTPRFLVAGDHVQLAAVVQNNTASALEGSVSLQVQGITLDDPASASQPLSLPPGGRQRVEWWGSVEDVTQVDLLFAAQAGGLEDITTPERGPIPVLSYSAPQVFGTSGVMDEGGERLEVVSLPLSFDPQGGDLRLELSPSLAAAILDALDALENYPYPSTEQAVSSFLPNLATYQVLRSFGLEQPDLQSRIERALDETVQRVLATQNSDGGWSWWPGSGTSDPYVSAYVIYGLAQLRAAGDLQAESALARGVQYLQNNLPAAALDTETWLLDQLAFELFALSSVDQAARDDVRFRAQQLFELREGLSPWAGAYLALAFEPGSRESQELLSGLQASALRSATGVHWQESDRAPQNLSTPIHTTAVVIYALAQRDPASSLLPDAVRYVMSHRTAQGGWPATYESAWTVLAMAEVMRGTAELSGDFGFSALVNDIPVAQGNAAGAARLAPVTATIPVSDLFFRSPNGVVFERDPGTGRLYYNLHLNILRPVEEVEPTSQGASLQRLYYPASDDCPAGCEPISSGTAAGLVQVRLAVTLSEDAYYLVVEDYLPAGAEIVDGRLKTSQQGTLGFDFEEPAPLYDPASPLAGGWGWWLFNDPRVYDDRIAWTASYLPAGTYELTYVMVLNQPGEYHVLPARAYQTYFPEVGGTSAGLLFSIGD